MGTWFNQDGLFIKFGFDEGLVKNTGEYADLGPLHNIEVELPLASLSTSAVTILSDTVTLPVGARIEEIEVVAETAATGTNATLKVGLIRTDRTTAYDDDGFVAALAQTTLTAGSKQVLRVGSTGAGALVGTTLTLPGLLVAGATTAVFTAGRAVVRIYYYIP